MRVLKRLCWALILIVAAGWGYQNRATVVPQAAAIITNARTNLSAALSGRLGSRLQDAASADSSTTQNQRTSSQANATSQSRASSQSTTSTTTAATPIESIVQNTTLAKTYYYHFDSQLSAAGRRVFKDAVATYNQTGLVNLVPGKASGHQNSVTFSVYYKKMPTGDTTIELGHGGPQITKQVSWRGTTYWNTATASLNGDYGAAYSKAVAVHELGHALGLDHSQSTASVMYPVSQGRSVLSSEDVAALKIIYQAS
ncbi:matrixin family metalloprotease [Lactiplantibacillus plajomi]|uniref:Matrixin family metalloprotease n=1 Tax=Lactiplantibacillus plajomi TaxID=1457217 RepID=A0ABV6K400_9LACO|nr:matrixin family metalloprotease [Lactiplantibacillus plajomi]